MQANSYIAFLLLMRYDQALSSKSSSPKNVPHLTQKRYISMDTVIASTSPTPQERSQFYLP